MHENSSNCVLFKIRTIADQMDLLGSHCNFHGINTNIIPTLIDRNMETIVYNFFDVLSKILFLACRKDINNDTVIFKNSAFII